jgi:hypothetical protein
MSSSSRGAAKWIQSAEVPKDLPHAKRIWPYYLAIVCLPLIVLWRQDNSLFTPRGRLDSWFYLGFFRNLANFKKDLFPDTYYGSRLSWILPGYLVHSIFSPVLASAILHVLVVVTAAFGLFTALRLAAGARAALLTTIVFVCNPQLWYEAGNDYVFGIGIAYSLLTAAALACAAAHPDRRRWLVLAGCSIAGMIYCNTFWVALAPLLLLYYVTTHWAQGQLRKQTFLRLATWTGAGFLAVTLVLCAVNYGLDGRVWFYAPSLRVIFGVMADNPWYQSPWTDYGPQPWLWLSGLATVLALIRLALYLRRGVAAGQGPALAFAIQLPLAAALLIYMQFVRHVAVLGWSYYAATLLPFTFLSFGTTFWKPIDRLTTRQYGLICCLATLLFGTIWWDYTGKALPEWPRDIWPALAIGLAGLAAALVVSRPAASVVLGLLGFAVLTSEVRIGPDREIAAGPPSSPAAQHAHRRNLERILKVRDVVESVRGNRPIRFWYDRNEAASEDYLALNSTYLYLLTLLPKPIPQVSCFADLEPGSLVVVPSMRPETANAAFGALANCGGVMGLRVSKAASPQIPSPYGTYTASVFRLDRDPARWHNVSIAAQPAGTAQAQLTGYSRHGGSLPLEQWTVLYPDLGTVLQPESDGLQLRTGYKPHTDAANYGPFVVPAAGRYGFVLHCTPESGNVAFGAVAADGITWLGADIVGHFGSEKKLEVWVDLDKGQSIFLRISHTTGPIATLMIHELTAVECDRPAATKSETPAPPR